MTPQAGAPLPAWANRLISELDLAGRTARELVAGLTPEQLNWQPAPNAWSVGQCLEHLCKTNDAFLPAISNSFRGKPAAAVAEITPGWFGRWFIRSFVEPSPRGKRARAPKLIAPGPRLEPSVLDRFLRSNEAACDLVRQASPYNVNRIRFRNPLFPVLRFTAGTGLEIVSKHVRRHLLQAARVKASENFPAR